MLFAWMRTKKGKGQLLRLVLPLPSETVFSFVSTDDDKCVRHCRNIDHVNTGCRDIRRVARRVGDPSSPLSHRADGSSTLGARVADGGATRRNRRSDNTLPPDGL